MKNMTGFVLIALMGFSPGWANAVPNSRYQINGDEVYDKVSDLTWQRCSVGQSWKESGDCTGTPRTFTFQEAQQQANDKWRVPSKDELASLVDHDRAEFPVIDVEAFPGMKDSIPEYWSSTSDGDERSWDVRFSEGGMVNDVIGYRFAVRLVHSGK